MSGSTAVQSTRIRVGSPPAQRAGRPTWRDPRLAIGLLLVAGSVLLGARVLADADDTVSVLATRVALPAGGQIDSDDLTVVQLRFTSEQDADRYLPGDPSLVDGDVLLRPVGAGELLPRSAVGTDQRGAVVELPLPVDPTLVPSTVRPGAVVDVWVSAPSSEGAAQASRVLTEVPVISLSRPSLTGQSGLRQVVVGVPPAAEPRLSRLVARIGDESSLLLVRHPS